MILPVPTSKFGSPCCFRSFVLLMESNTESSLTSSTITTTPSTTTPASSFVNLFLNEINNQDVHGLLDVQRSL
jgi:hypothetical protein